VEVLKQPPYSPIPVEKQVAILFAGANGYLDDVEIDAINRFEVELYRYLDNSKPELLQAIREKKELNDDIKNQLHGALKEFKQRLGDDKDQSAENRASRAGTGHTSEKSQSGGPSANGSRPPANVEPPRTPARV
jgi:ElaB/YqjD/DUF883 family membrane-anchored ribosome-binding protein